MNPILFAASTQDITYTVLFELGLIIVIGLIIGRLFEYAKIPDVTGYLFAGLLLGPIFGIISHVENLEVISSVALGFIAFEIGTELWIGKLKKCGSKVIVITVVQAILTFMIVSGLLSLVLSPAIAIILGAIATATAPAPIMVLTKKFKCKGPLTDTLLPVVGIDDALGIFIFGLAVAIAKPLAFGGSLDLFNGFALPLLEIAISVVVGAILGFVIGVAIRNIDNNSEKEQKFLDVTVIGVILAVASARVLSDEIHMHISPILVPMIAGFVFTNMVDKNNFRVEERVIHSFTPPLMIAFFTIAGIELDLMVFMDTQMLIGIGIYIFARVIGKVLGSYTGACMCHAEENVKKYLGFALLPQAGVSIGLAIAASSIFPGEMGNSIQAIILASIVIFEFFGPLLVTYSLRESREIRDERFSKKDIC
jgi:Kef-type K+ transport system membrane component KefB